MEKNTMQMAINYCYLATPMFPVFNLSSNTFILILHCLVSPQA